MALDKQLGEIDADDLRGLVEAAVPELRTMEYKAALPGRGDEEKREFLADASSFANTASGHLIFGMGADAGVPTDAAGVELGNIDEQKLWFENTIRDGIAPRLPGVGIHPVEVEDGRYVFVLRIQRSWLGPHMVTFKNLSRFFARNSAGKYQLDVGEIRTAMLSGSLFSDRVRAFRAERIAAVIANSRLSQSPKIVVHLIPVDAFDDVHPSVVLSDDVTVDARLRPLYTSDPRQARWNLDGLYVDNAWGGNTATNYLQLFRSGLIEAIEGYIIGAGNGRGPQNADAILGYPLEEILINDIARLLQLQGDVGAAFPVTVLVSLLGVEGRIILTAERYLFREDATVIDRDVLLLPDVVAVRADADTAVLLRPVFDALWQSAGRSRSPNYDQNGDWQRRA